jgi:acyl transferase domain-containing protein
LKGGNVGVYAGVSSSDYAQSRLGDPASGDSYFMTGIAASIVANRVSHFLDLRGPSLAVDTACSSSLVAIHLGCEALRNGEVDVAIVGGVNLLLSPYSFLGFSQASMLSPTGRCYAFDRRANGYVRAEGAGVVILKRLSAARAEADRIRALILGTGVNSDGHTIGLSLPSEKSQSSLLTSLYHKTGIDPNRLDFVEAHGTGTPVGDPIELAALGKSLGRNRTSPLLVGSAKSNVGHLEAASGMVGLIKAILALEHRLLPASLHFESPNPNIAFQALNLEVVTAPRPLAPAPAQLVAGVNSFGFGGTNAHAILASAPLGSQTPSSAVGEQRLPLLLSARSRPALAALAGRWSRRLAATAPDEVEPLLRAAARRRDHHPHRLNCPAADPGAMAARLAGFAEGRETAEPEAGAALPSARIAFVYSGNGAQFVGMAADALQHGERFRAALHEVDALLAPQLGWSPAARLLTADAEDMRRADVAQPLLFSVQVAITEALRAAGVAPEVCLGHSVGEIAAAWAAGALSLATASRIVVVRSRQQHRAHGAGSMAAVAVDAETVAEEIARIGRELELAAVNSRTSVTIAGPVAALDRLAEAAAAKGWRYTRLDLDYPFHSSLLDPIRSDLIAGLAGIEAADCVGGFVSTVFGRTIPGSRLTAEYWWQNVRCPVRFADALAEIVPRSRLLLEIGPHPVLQSYLREALRAAEVEGRVMPSLSRQPAGADPFARIAGRCYAAGYDLAHSPIFEGPWHIDGLPTYPWQRERHAPQPTSEGLALATPLHDAPLLGFRFQPDASSWTQSIDLETAPWLCDHAVEGVAVVPAAALVEIALAVARSGRSDAAAVGLDELEVRKALVIDGARARTLRVTREPDRRLRIESRERLSDESWTLHAVAQIAAAPVGAPCKSAPVRAGETIDARALYARAQALGLDYGPRFRVVSRVEVLDQERARAWLDAPAKPDGAPSGPSLSTLLDGGLQAFLALFAEPKSGRSDVTLLPWRLAGIRLFAPFERLPSHVELAVTQRGTRSACGSLTYYDKAGTAVAAIAECWFRQVRLFGLPATAAQTFHFVPVAKPHPGEETPVVEDPPQLLSRAARAPSAQTQDVALLFDGFIAAVAQRAIRDLCAGRKFSVADLVEGGALAAEAAPVAAHLLDLLSTCGAARDADGAWHIDESADLPEPDLIWRSILAEGQALTAELALAATAAEALPAFLRSGSQAAAMLPPPMVEHLLYASPAGRLVVDELRGAVIAVAAGWPTGRPLRILEIGAGSGMLSRSMLDALDGWAGTLSYVATDRDPRQAERLAAELRDYAGVSAGTWDPRNSSDPGAPASSFDLIVAAYALTRGNFGVAELAALRQMLAPGGRLLIAEPAPNHLWTWLFGQQRAWWRGSSVVAAPRPAEEWRATLRAAELEPSAWRDLATSPWPAMVLAARRGMDAALVWPGKVLHGRGAIFIVADPTDARAVVLEKALAARGCTAQALIPPEVGDGAGLCAALQSAAPETPEIILLPPHRCSEGDCVGGTVSRLVRAITLARLVASSCEQARLWLVTEDAQQSSTGRASAAAEDAALWGMGRVLANEMQQLQCRLVDLSSRLSDESAAARLALEVATPDGEIEIVWSPAGRQVLRLRQAASPRSIPEPCRLSISMPGRLDTLYWEPLRARAPEAGEVAIAVHAADLNFRDLMWALDLLPEEALLAGYAGPTLGLACAGVVRRVGAGVTGFAPGDRVVAIAPSALSTEAVTTAACVSLLPAELDFAAAATLPVAFVTVIYALGHLAQLKQGERVLIHGAAGGIGLAAIQFAKHHGAEVFATAGAPAKRAFLRQLGADHVFDSRDLGFADAIRTATAGQGVDVVLNSLSGEAMEESLGLVRPFGRFIELGKRDFYLGTRIGLRPLRCNVSYFAVDIDALPRERPELAAALLRQAMELIESKTLRPLPYRGFTRREVSDAFRLMQGAGHIGKIVFDLNEAPASLRASLRSAPPLEVRGDATYLVTGGLSGFGLASAEWLAKHGARSLALLGRRGSATPGAGAALARLAAAGIAAPAFAAMSPMAGRSKLFLQPFARRCRRCAASSMQRWRSMMR